MTLAAPPLVPVTFRGLAYTRKLLDDGRLSHRPALDRSAPAPAPSHGLDAEQLRATAQRKLRDGATASGAAPRPRRVRFCEADAGAPGAAEPPPLDNPQIEFPHLADDYRLRRSERWKLRRGLSHLTTLERVKFCGAPLGGLVGVKHADAMGAGFAGLQTCGSVWACPVCAPKIGAKRAEDLAVVLRRARRRGYRIGLVTLTVQHRATDELRATWDAVASGWKAIITGKTWEELRARHDVVGYTRSVEATIGHHGWHVHVHALVIVKGDAEAVSEHMWTRWAAGVKRAGYFADRKAFRFDLVQADSQAVADYVTKQSDGGIGAAAREATMSATKVGRARESRTPFGLLADVVSRGTAAQVAALPDRERKAAQRDVARWIEWETASRRRRALTWSKGLRSWAQLQEDEPTDEEVAATDHGGDWVLVIPRATYLALRSADMLCELLEVVEDSAGSTTATAEWLSARGLDWSPPPRPAEC